MKKAYLLIAYIFLCTYLFEFSLNGQGSIDSLAVTIPGEKTIKQSIPVVSTGSILTVGIQQATITGSITTNQPLSIKSVGICLDTKPHPTLNEPFRTSNSDSGRFILKIEELLPGTVYFVMAFAETLNDTVFGEEKAFYTHKTNSVPDVEGNYYNTVQIGKQVWLAEDLKTSRFNDGTLIPLVAESEQWGKMSTPAYCWYGNDSAKYSFPRGKLYNWYAVNTGKICPAGWHVPSDPEWTALSSFLGGDTIAGGKLKTQGTVFWREPNAGATNVSGFSAFPGGYRNSSGRFLYVTIFDDWWSSTEVLPEAATHWYVYHAQAALYHQIDLRMFGHSVRCIKNE
jgi:uncharacterized protein (TIGR02145 family)